MKWVKGEHIRCNSVSHDCSHYSRKPSVVIRHSGLDESGDSNASEGSDFMLSANGHLDITTLPKGWS